MTLDDIKIQSQAMKLKMKRFNLIGIIATFFYSETLCKFEFVDNSGHMWVVQPSYINMTFIAHNADEESWMKSLKSRLDSKDLINRCRVCLTTDEDYAMCFNFMLLAANANGQLDLYTAGIHPSNIKSSFPKFFSAYDTAEETLIQYDLYSAKPNNNINEI